MIIAVTAGATEYASAVITERTGKSLDTATVQLALGTDSRYPPAIGWTAPDVVEHAGATVTAKMLITSGAPLGTFYLWARVADNPEVIPVRAGGDSILIR